jgi:hypothetical protein
MPCEEAADNLLHHIRILHPLIRVVGGLPNVLWWTRTLNLATAAGLRFSGT